MIIAITGYKQSGKDTIAKYLCEKYGYVQYSCASPIKEAAKDMFNWTDEHVNGELKEVLDPRWGIMPRQVLQSLGTEYGQFMLSKMYPLFAEITGRKLWVRNFHYWYNY